MKDSPQFRKLQKDEEFLALKASLKKSLPRTGQMLNILNLEIQKRFSKTAKVDFFIYEENYNFKKALEEPFVIVIQRPNIHSLYGMFLEVPIHNLTQQMIDLFEKFVEWDKILLFSSVNQKFYDDHLKSLCFKHGGLQTTDPNGLECEGYAMDTEEALKYECPNLSTPGCIVEVRELSVKDSTEMLKNYSRWERPHTKLQLEESIRNMTSCGVYVNGKLASSAVLSPVGLMNILYTDEAYRGKGYGKVVLKTLGKYISKMGLIPRAECEVINNASRQVQMKSGMKFVEYINWIRFK